MNLGHDGPRLANRRPWRARAHDRGASATLTSGPLQARSAMWISAADRFFGDHGQAQFARHLCHVNGASQSSTQCSTQFIQQPRRLLLQTNGDELDALPGIKALGALPSRSRQRSRASPRPLLPLTWRMSSARRRAGADRQNLAMAAHHGGSYSRVTFH
jgi:hypothetical protein